ncbi:malto-oligosyltrehalose synthase [Phenylobacterium sp.]|uniref:malto-oligosyltrehalose synthase n=1 Tax=Phenylobacterium sp. TaxID=1871053 RepID=UPI002731854D|nr:malto-oligosyltrehalose synthase [Phenylobacterium sp.]MDP1619274.1 malto-oligosyltrehalose synthase [Phenylobacterium sp.]MDP1986376.1 malto-oligosyltrehalose synthase [Phenylobacterium sp.]
MTPTATYRLQFHAGFTFADGAGLAGYLRDMGVSHVYASPIAVARAGSTHGYDVVDPTAINPALGGEDGFRQMVAALKAEGLGVILDIVPNHLAVGGADNAWWLDVLEKGEASAFAGLFDIDWRPRDPALQGKVLAPFLGAPYGEALAGGDIRLEAGPDGSLWATAYGHHRFPIREADRAEVFALGLEAFDPAEDAGRARLHDLLERQAYRLAWWQTAGDEINWRRFFDITELAGVRVEVPEVFDRIHALPLRLYAEGLIDGLRIDHIDGLADPAGYLTRLRGELAKRQSERPKGSAAGPAYLVVEKILAEGEALSRDWACDGTTGYEFMDDVSALLHEPGSAAPLAALWREISRREGDYGDEEHAARREILTHGFAGQVEAVVGAFHDLARDNLKTRDLTQGALRRAITQLLTGFSAYRLYGEGEALSQGEAGVLAGAMEKARAAIAPADRPALDQIETWLTGGGPGTPDARRRALQRFHQLSAPVAAKSAEDTAFYRYLRLISRNEVGSYPGRLASDADEFHAANPARAEAWPASMLTTATHDHKRGEDVRARLAVLSERPDLWAKAVRAWLDHAPPQIDPADAYQMHQTLVGALPLDLDLGDAAGLKIFGARVAGWFTKALREGKLRSSWAVPDEAYEAACLAYLQQCLADPAYRAELSGLVEEIAPAGAIKSLAQALLRCASPGVPDTYQGTELWDFSLVDPDNRRPVDFALRQEMLRQSVPAELMADWRTGAVKQFVIRRTLSLRKARPEIFARGEYNPLRIQGRRKDAVIAFARRTATDTVIAAAVMGSPSQFAEGRPLPDPVWWDDTVVLLEAGQGVALHDHLGGQRHSAGALPAARLFEHLPVALLARDRPDDPAPA